jgi:polysaccharide deacetylase 2 family uncharacterized protein YibQ
LARKGTFTNRRKASPGGKKPLLALLIVALLIAAAFFLLERSRKTAPPASVATGANGNLPLPERPVSQQKLSTASLPAVKAPAAAAPHSKKSGQLAIIIDDMGSSNKELQELLSIEQPLTFSVIPSLAHAKEVAESAHKAGAEVMVHMPMEPEGYPKQKLEKIGLLLSMDAPEVIERVNSYFRTVPFAVGANNHMGSRYTQDAEKMEVVLKVLKGKGLYFVDSRTSPASVGYKTARALGLKCATRQVFLDNVQDEAAIGKQLAEAVAIAKKSGGAIAICHPHPSTIHALQSLMPELARSGITFVHASALTS